ncbi:MAG: aminopeptidase P family protein [Candidatus Cloacimonetes bacterium]|nr:aminopeptidase P family protein [Candidatus Cloacimonadota bacterium]MCF7814393.1 aminopeptidase P family protein [Candidatus Cloacimonadota bacterium]MCF7868527.1 aminopeptidase P family protein [Candidatus Cloacimonadota bacterium]MCF7884053.1 aminopeptidase P family protein [Candidatus Cloacimonadota bacterium]
MYSERRDKLNKQLENNEILIVFAASESSYPSYFWQDSNFLYCTGLQIPDAVFVQRKVKDKLQTTLFIERGIPEMEVWEGKKLTKQETTKLSGIKTVSFLDELERKMQFYLNGMEKCYINLNNTNLSKPLNKQQIFANKIKEHFPNITIDEAMKRISPLRAIKDKWEIKQMQKAIDVTGAGIASIMKNAKAGMMEYELEAELLFASKKAGFRHLGFHPIIASGVNAATLHYSQNNSKIGKNDLILMDLGLACNGYSSDITRTFPVSGKFTKRQKDVYQEVLNVNKEIISMIKPGVSLQELNKKTVELITEALFRLKLIKEKSEYFKYYMHSVGHHLGMAAHDVGPRDTALEAGNVITVEPGIYIPKEKIGVRIEDDILVTKTGHKNLSQNIPKEVDELEK